MFSALKKRHPKVVNYLNYFSKGSQTTKLINNVYMHINSPFFVFEVMSHTPTTKTQKDKVTVSSVATDYKTHLTLKFQTLVTLRRKNTI